MAEVVVLLDLLDSVRDEDTIAFGLASGFLGLGEFLLSAVVEELLGHLGNAADPRIHDSLLLVLPLCRRGLQNGFQRCGYIDEHVNRLLSFLLAQLVHLSLNMTTGFCLS